MDSHIEEAINSGKITGKVADDIIVNLIDNCNNEDAARAMGVSDESWNFLITQFEEQIRHRVREIR